MGLGLGQGEGLEKQRMNAISSLCHDADGACNQLSKTTAQVDDEVSSCNRLFHIQMAWLRGTTYNLLALN
jgi:hypothetical protein